MTVATTLNKKQYQGNDLTTEFPLPFHVTDKEHIFALLKKGTAIHEIKNNFAVDLERKVFIYPVQGEAIKTGESLTVYRKVPLTQIVDLENAGAFHPEVLEHDGFDRIVMQIQQIDEEISRALKIDITDTRDVTNLIEELFKAREEAVFSAQKALEQAELAADKAEKTQNWALFAEEKVKELTDLDVECFISNDGQGQVTYDKDRHKLEIVLPFDNTGLNQPEMVLTDSVDLARSDIGASARAVQNLHAKINQEMTNALSAKLDKTALSDAINSASRTNAASSAAVNDLRKQSMAFPSLDYIDIQLDWQTVTNSNRIGTYVAPADGYIMMDVVLNSVTNSVTQDGDNIYITIIKKNSEGENIVVFADSRTCWSRQYPAITAPVRKGNIFNVAINGYLAETHFVKFVYAEGALL